MNRSLARIAAVLVMSIIASVMLASPAQARVVKRVVKVQGLRVTVPAGYTLRWNKGTYTLANRQRFVKITYGRSAIALKPTANQVAKGLKGSLSGVKAAKNGRTLSATITRYTRVRGKRTKVVYKLVLTRRGIRTTIQLYGRKAAARRGVHRRSAATGRATDIFGPIVTALDVAQLNRILQSRRGVPRVIPLNLSVPMKRFQANVQNGASALVPNLPGWNYNGTDTGYLTGGNISQGTFELGGFRLVSYPAFPAQGTPVAQPDGNPATALAQVLPQHWKAGSGMDATFTNIQEIPGFAGVLGAGYISSRYQAAFTINGTPWVGVFTVGVSDAVQGISWGFYFSYVAVPVNGPGGVAQALMTTWSTWNNDAAVTAGLNRTMNIIRTTKVPGAPIDPAVFEYTNQLWTDYIRG